MSNHGKAIIRRLHPLSPLQDENNDGHKVIDDTIGEYLDRYELRKLPYQLFILHATGKFLDLHGWERGVIRKNGESDDTYRARILLEKGMHNCIADFRKFGVDFWDYVTNLGAGSQEFYLQVTTDEGVYRKNLPVTLYVENSSTGKKEVYNAVTNYLGIASFKIVGLNEISNYYISIDGDDEYNPVSINTESVEGLSWKKNTLLLMNDIDIIRHEYFKVQLVTVDGTAISGEDITFKIIGKEYTLPTNEEGIAQLQINLFENNYDISYTFAGNDEYNPCKGSTVINDISTGNKENQYVRMGILNDVQSSTLTSKNTYLKNRYLAHANLSNQRKLQNKFINSGVVEWF